MIDKQKVCVIIGSYPQNYKDTTLLGLTIESFKTQGYDICLVSHSPINQELQQASKYTIYSDENQILKFPTPSVVTEFCDGADLRFQTNHGNKVGQHSFAVLMNLKNGLWLLKNKKYTHFIYVENDTFLTSKDQKLLENKLEEFNFMENDYWFMLENQHTQLVATSLFGGKIDVFSDALDAINSPEDYLKIEASSLEAFMGKLFTNKDYYYDVKPRDLFESKWLGISSYGTISFPGIDNKLTVMIDIVRNLNDEENVFFIVNKNDESEDVNVRLYRDNQMVVLTDIKTGPLYYWGYQKQDTNIWKMEVLVNDKIISQVERTTEEIFWNRMSYFEIKNNQ